MYLTITRFEITQPFTRAEVARMFEQSMPRYAAVPGLLSKQYYLEREGLVGGGIYLWARREDAEAFLTPAFAEGLRARFGSLPTVQAMDCPVWLDNAHQDQRVELPAD